MSSIELNPFACNAKSPTDLDGMVWYCGFQSGHVDEHDWQPWSGDLVEQPPLVGRWK